MPRPHWRIIGVRHELTLSLHGDEEAGSGQRLRGEAAVRALDGALAGTSAWGFAARTLDAIARAGGGPGSPRDVVRRALRQGRLDLWRDQLRVVAAPLPAPLDEEALLRAPPSEEDSERTWIEIELTDMEGNPVRGERYWIKLPDGTVREGALNEQGRAYFGGLDAGSAEIRWPDLDEEATVSAPRADSAPRREGAPERTWVEIELTDMEGNPLPRERYWIKLPDGSVREGALDAEGRAYFDDLDPGACEIRWPDLDEEATVAAPDATTSSPTNDPEAQAATLEAAARDGVPFCEECARAAAARRASAA
jgi:hypothetical protein